MNSRVAGLCKDGLSELFNLLERAVEYILSATIIFVHHVNETALTTFDVHVTVHRVKFLVIKPTRCTDFSNLFLE